MGRLITRYTAPLREAGVDTVVLGCTHYPFAAHRIAHSLGPQVTLIDTSEAVARQAHRLAATLSAHTMPATPRTTLWTSGDPRHLNMIATRWLDFTTDVRALSSA